MNKSKLTAIEKSPWDFGDFVLYDLGQKKPDHDKNNPDVALAKMLLIGRAYSASIERGAGKHRTQSIDYYPEKVAPMLTNSNIDSWIGNLNKIKRIEVINYEILLDAHFNHSGSISP